MARFFFDLYDDMVVLDGEGVDLPDFTAAHARAVKGIHELICAEVGRARLDLNHRIEVRSEDGSERATIHFGDVVTVVHRAV